MATPNVLALASLTQALLASQQVGSTNETAIYTVPANKAVKLAQGSLCNTTSAPVTVSLSLVPSGGTADGTHRVIASYSLAAYDTLPLGDYLGGHMLGPGDFISVQASAATAVTVVISGAVSA
jgi:hypothetical protein